MDDRSASSSSASTTVSTSVHDEVCALLARDAGARVRIEAVPGAGKTALIVRACVAASEADAPRPSLVLAYNKQLAADIGARLPPDGTLCLTFHALCSRCLAPARDDAQLLDAVERAERGELVASNVPSVGRVFVDEAQDVREVYVRLVRVLGLHTSSLVVAGDRNQLVYDFDPDAPATLETLESPSTVFAPDVVRTNDDHDADDDPTSKWSSFVLTTSYRLTAPIATLVNAVFRTSIVAAGVGTPLPVDVRAPKNMWTGLYDVLRDVLEADDDLLLLVDYKNGNTALRKLLNTVSRRGSMCVRIHGVDVDGDDRDRSSSSSTATATAKPTLTCGTFWSAKGLQCRTCVVLLPEQAARNPTYVALTRASHRLIVVLDSRRPHPNVCTALCAIGARAHESATVRYADAFARHVVKTGALGHVDGVDGLCKREWTSSATDDDGHHTRSLDRWTPQSNAVAATIMHRAHRRDADGGEDESSHAASAAVRECSADVVVHMCLVAAESDAKDGRVRAVEDVVHPTRLDRARHAGAIRAGCASRFVSPFATDDELLAPDLRSAFVAAYDRMLARSAAAAAAAAAETHAHKKTRRDARRPRDATAIADIATVALGVTSFDSWDHTMRTLLPSVRAWSPSVAPHLDFVASVLPATASFDVRLCGDSCHVRVHATTPDSCFHVVWESSSSDVAAAGLRAALHPAHVCTLVDVSARTCADVGVEAHDVARFLQS